MVKTEILVDSNLFVALVVSKDSLSKKADKLFADMVVKNKIIINQYIYQESLTVSVVREKNIKPGILLTEKLFNKKEVVEIFYIPEIWQTDIIKLFLNQKKYKGGFLSYTDCSLIVQARKQGIRSICTFDETFKQFSREFKILS